MIKYLKFFTQNKILLFLVLLSLVLKISFLPQWMDDWDSIQLAMGLHEYSLPKHQPHPPGYPVYILFGKMLFPIFQTDILTLTMMSAIFGTLTLIPLYFLTKQIFSQKLAILSCLIFIFTPVTWLLSISALTDIVGLFFLTLTACLLYKFINDKKKTVWVSLLAGFSIGVRFNEFPVILGLLLWVMIKQRSIKFALYQFLALITGGLFWLIPMILITGPNEFYQTFTSNGAYVAEHDLLLGNTHSIPGLIKAKLLLMLPLFKWGFTLPFTILFLICLAFTLVQRKLWNQNWYQLTLIFLLSYCVLLVTFFNLELPRHIMPLIIPMILVIVFTVKALTEKNFLFWIIPLGLLITIEHQGYSQVSRFHIATPATIGPVLYVKENFKPEATVIYGSYTLRNFQYYAPEFKSIDSESNKSIITPEKTVVTDLVNLNQDPALKDFEEIDTRYFQSDKDIFPKVDTIQLHILESKHP